MTTIRRAGQCWCGRHTFRFHEKAWFEITPSGLVPVPVKNRLGCLPSDPSTFVYRDSGGESHTKRLGDR